MPEMVARVSAALTCPAWKAGILAGELTGRKVVARIGIAPIFRSFQDRTNLSQLSSRKVLSVPMSSDFDDPPVTIASLNGIARSGSTVCAYPRIGSLPRSKW